MNGYLGILRTDVFFVCLTAEILGSYSSIFDLSPSMLCLLSSFGTYDFYSIFFLNY